MSVHELQVIDRLEQAAHLSVDVLDGVDVGLLGIGIAHFVGYIQRDVRHGVRQVHEERLVLVGLDEVDGLLRVPARDGALVDGQLDNLLVLKERRLPLGECGLGISPQNVHSLPSSARLALVVRVIHVVRVRDAVVGVEAVGRWQRFLVMPEMPFAETSGGIALPFQVIGNGVFLRVQPLRRGRKQHVLMHAHALGITAGQQRRTRRCTHRRGYHEAREFPPLLGNSIDVRRLDGLGAETTQVAIALIVCKDDHKIGFGRKR